MVEAVQVVAQVERLHWVAMVLAEAKAITYR